MKQMIASLLLLVLAGACQQRNERLDDQEEALVTKRRERSTLETIVLQWSTTVDQCVDPPPVPGSDADYWRTCRPNVSSEICARHHETGGDVDETCDQIQVSYSSCDYGNCGEAALYFGCEAHERGLNPGTCTSAHDHVFDVVPDENNPGKYCILDRWEVTSTGANDVGSVVCGVTIEPVRTGQSCATNADCTAPRFCATDIGECVANTVIKDGAMYPPGGHPYYQDLACDSFENYLRFLCSQFPEVVPPTRVVVVDHCEVGATYMFEDLACTVVACALLEGTPWWNETAHCELVQAMTTESSSLAGE